jgi:uncharacterized peroxidase-related enzyme
MHTLDTAPEESRRTLEELKRRNGFIHNLMRVLAESPATLEAYAATAGALAHGRLSRAERETVAITASIEGGCDYCVATHSAAALRQKVPAEVVSALRDERPLADARLEALRAFTRVLLRTRGWASDAEQEALFAAGFDRGQLLEIVAWVAHMTLTNYVNHLAHVPLDEMFAAQRWSRGEQPAVH